MAYCKAVVTLVAGVAGSTDLGWCYNTMQGCEMSCITLHKAGVLQAETCHLGGDLRAQVRNAPYKPLHERAWIEPMTCC